MTTTESRRATTLAELNAKMARLVTEPGYAAGLEFVPRPSDVIIASYAKCGTTWLQQMAHSLRTGGDLDFDDISRVVPWIETASDLGIDLGAAQRGDPRIFKSHLAYDDVPSGARYIVSVRDPRDALVSAYRFLEGWFFEPGSIDIEALGRAHFVEGRSYYTHLVSWWPHRHDPDVLLLAYEHMKRDHEGAVRRVAEFIGEGTDAARLAIACQESSLASMKLHQDRYDDKLMRERSEVACDLPPGSVTSKVGAGEVGAHQLALSEALIDELDKTWRDTMTAELGLSNYGALLELLEFDG
jgi:Sulfotransferase domain